MQPLSILGMIAGLLTSASMLPQCIKMVKTKSTKDVSVISLSMNITGMLLWDIYGMILHDVPLVLWNSTSICVVSSTLAYKLYNERHTLFAFAFAKPANPPASTLSESDIEVQNFIQKTPNQT